MEVSQALFFGVLPNATLHGHEVADAHPDLEAGGAIPVGPSRPQGLRAHLAHVIEVYSK